MTHPAFNIKKLLIAGGTTFAMLAVPMAVNTVTGLDLGVISSAQAAEDGGHAGGSGKGGAKKGGSDKGGAYKGGKGGESSKKVLRAPVDTAEDSDCPAWAGVKGGKAGGGGKPAGAGSKKGDLFGDMVIILRDVNGVPILNDAGLVQVIAYYYPEGSTTLVPLKDAEGNLVTIPYNAEGDLLTTVTVGTTTYDVVGAEVDLGRLSVGRAPTKVLDKSLTDALTTLSSGTIGIDVTGRLTVTSADGTVSTIDSPLANLALYDAIMSKTIVPGVAYTIPGTTTTLTLPTSLSTAALFAAASDKTGIVNVDMIVYMNSILGVNTDPTNFTTYYDFSTVNYSRSATWDGVTVQVLMDLDGDGTFKVENVDVYEYVFKDTDWTDPTATGGADDFATMSDDYLQVLEFVHDNAVR